MEFYTILTDAGRALEAAALAGQTRYTLATCALGDGGGMPDPTQTALRNEVWRGAINAISPDIDNPTWLIIETHVPQDEGGFTIREFGIYTDTGVLFAVGNYPEIYKPTMAEGTGVDLVVRPICEVSNAESVTLLTDPAIVMVSKKYLDEELKKIPRRNVGEVFYYQGKEAPFGAVVADGGLLSRAVYPDLWTFAQEKGQLVSETHWQEQALNQSSVGVFSTGDGKTTFRVPKLADYLRGTTDLLAIGNWQKGSLVGSDVNADESLGTFHINVRTGASDFWESAGLDYPNMELYPDVVTQNMEFMSKALPPPDLTCGVVRPNSIRLLPCIHAYDAIIPKAQADMAGVLTVLNGKEDRLKRLPEDGSFLTLYVRTDGNDANDGLADTPDRAFRTINRAIIATDGYHFPRNPVARSGAACIKVGPGTYNESVTIGNYRTKLRRIDLEATDPSNKPLIVPPQNAHGVLIASSVQGIVTNIRVQTEGITFAFICQNHGWMGLRDVEASGSGQDAFLAGDGGELYFLDNSTFKVSGTWTRVLRSDMHAKISASQGSSFQMNSVTATSATAYAIHTGVIYMPYSTFTGTVTGPRYFVGYNGVILSGFSGENYFPGTTAGTVMTGGEYQ